MALKPFNTVGGLSVGPNVANVVIDTNNGDSNVANYKVNTTGYGNVTLGAVANLHISGGNANAAVLGSVTLNGDGNVTAIAITSRGDGYTIAPTITISGSNSVPANATVSLYANGAINTISINNAGTGYTAATATISSPSTKYLNTDGNGNLGWSEVVGTGGGGSGTPGGSNTQIQFNDNGAFGASDGLTYNKTTNVTTFGANANSQVLVGPSGNLIFTANNGTAVKQVTLVASNNANFTGNYTLTLPVDDGNSGQALTTNGSGVLSWSTPSLLANGNSNVSIPAANGNVTISAVGNANVVVVTGTGVSVNGNITMAAANGTINFVTASNVANASLANIQGGVGTNGNGIILQTGSAATDGVQIAGSGRIQATNGSAALVLNNAGNVRTGANLEVGYITSNSGVILNANTFQTGIFASNALVANYNIQLPSNVAQYNNQVLLANTDGTTRFVTLSNITTANGNSSVSVTANANVTVTANGNAVVTVTSSGDGNLQTTGGNVTGYWNVSGNAVAANFVGTLANGNSNIRIAANGGVGVSATGQSNIIAVTSNGTFATTVISNDVTVTGNLTVQGNAIYANTESLTVEDPIIELGTGANGAILTTNDGKDRGLELHTYGNGNTYTTSSSTVVGNTTITIADTRGITTGMYVTTLTGAIPPGTTVSTVNTNANIVISSATTAVINSGNALQIGNDTLRFMGWSNANAEFQFYSNATVTNEVVSGTLGNVNANTFIGALQGNLVNGNSNVTIAANGNVTVGVAGNANIITATGSNVILGNGVGAILTSNNGTGIRQVQLKTSTDANFSANYAITLPITAGSNLQFLQTDGTGVTSWKTIATVAAEWHVATNGNDTTGNGSIVNPYLTIGKALTSVGSNLHNVIVVHPGTYVENVTVTGNSVTITGTAQTGDAVNLQGNLTFSGSASYNHVNGLLIGNLIHSASGSLYVYDSQVGSTAYPGTVSKSGGGYLEINDCDLQTGNLANGVLTSVSVTGAGTVNLDGVHTYDLTVNNSSAVVLINNSLSTANATVTAGNVAIADSFLYSYTNGGNALTATGGVVQINGSSVLYPNLAPGKLNIGASAAYGYENIVFDRPNSTLSGTNLSLTADFQNIRTDGIKTTDSVTFVSANTSANIANINAATLTTTTTTANQAVAKITAANGRAVEFIIKAIDSTGAKYYASTILAMAGNVANADLDYSTYAVQQIGTTPGAVTIALTDSNANITLQVTPASTNSTVWTTQYRVI